MQKGSLRITIGNKKDSFEQKASILTKKFASINPKKRLFSLKSPKNCRKFYCTCLLRNSKLVHVDAKNLALITQNLVWNGLRLLLASKTHRK